MNIKSTVILFRKILFIAILTPFLLFTKSAFSTGGGNGGGGDGGGGGGPSFSNSAPGSSSTCGAGSLNNSNASVAGPCLGGSSYSAADVGLYEDCNIYIKGAGVWRDACTCWGSMENNIWSQFCAPATGQFDFEVTNVSCSGGGSSLQFFVAPTPGGGFTSICDLTSEYCNKGSTGDKTHSVDLTSGTCYTIMFDGNAGADCTWDFNINCAYALGLTMVDYDAKLSNDQNEVEVFWDIIDEYDVSHYVIQRSSDGKNYEDIGEVDSKNIGDDRYKYSFMDGSPLNGTNYYKLIQVEENGKEYTYSERVVTKTKSSLNIYPNPIKNDLNLTFGQQLNPNTEIKIYDILGNLVHHEVLGKRSSNHKIDLNSTEKGIYYIFIEDGKSVIQQKFYKN